MSLQKKDQSLQDWLNLVAQISPVQVFHNLPDKLSTKIEARLVYIDLPPYIKDLSWKSVGNTHSSVSVVNDDFFNLLIDSSPSVYFQTIKKIILLALETLSCTGFLCLKVVGTKKHYVKILLDQVLGYNCFVNEIHIDSPYNLKYCQNQNFVESTGSLFLYSLSSTPRVNEVRTVVRRKGYWHTMHSKGQGTPKVFTVSGEKIAISPPIGNHWKFKQETIDQMCQNGQIKLNSKGQPLYWVKPSKGQIIDTFWLDLCSYRLSDLGLESSEALISRLLQLTTKKRDLFIHVFCGNGYGLIAAEKLDRKWVGLDSREISTSGLEMDLSDSEGQSSFFKIRKEDFL